MKKIFKLFIGLLLFSNTLSAFDLNTLTSKLAENKVTSGDFEQIKTIMTSKGARNIKSKGTFVLSPDAVMWNTTIPFSSKLIITKSKVIQIDSKNNQNIIDGTNNATFSSISSTIASIFSNDLEVLNDKFTYELKLNDDFSWNLVLTPKDQTINSVIKSITLDGKYTDSLCSLDGLSLTENDGNQIQYLFINQTYSKIIEDESLLSFIE